MSALHSVKKELRQRIKKALGDVSAESIQRQSNVVTQTIFRMRQYRDAQRISVYLSMPQGEIQTSHIVGDALQSGKRVFVPYYYRLAEPQEGSPRSIMDMLELKSIQDFDGLTPDNWGIPTLAVDSLPERVNSFGSKGKSEGAITGTESSESGLDLVILPGMAFDHDLGRLGHGKGFYDYFLERTRRNCEGRGAKMPYLAGLSLAEQLLPTGQTVPQDTTDWPLDAVIVGDGSVIVSRGDDPSAGA